MMFRTSWFALSLAALCACAGQHRAVSAPPAGQPARARVARSQSLPPLDGRRLQGAIVEVTYEPGGSSPPHSHPCPVMGYVMEGAIRMRVKGEAEATYRAGQTFYEAPDGVHELSANASAHAPAKFLAIFVCDRDTPRTVPVSAVSGRGS